MPVVGSNSWAMRRGAAIILTTVAKGTTMPNDDLIAALGRVVAMLSRAPAWHQQSDDAATIRALIADLRAENLVRREDVVTQERAKVVAFSRRKAQEHHRIASDAGGDDELRITHVALSSAYGNVADAVAAGAHEGGGGE